MRRNLFVAVLILFGIVVLCFPEDPRDERGIHGGIVDDPRTQGVANSRSHWA